MEGNLGQIEFKISRSYIKKILITFIIIASIFIYVIGTQSNLTTLEKILLFLIPIIGFCIYLANLLKYKVIVNNEKITVKSLFNNKFTRLGLLGDYSFQKEGIVISTTYGTDFTISLPLEEQKLFTEWLSHYSQNPEREKDTELYIVAREELESNKLFGKNPTELAANLKKARHVTYVLLGVAILNFCITFYSVFLAEQNPYPVLISILMPFLCLFVIYYFKGLIIIGINPEKLRAYPNLVPTLGFSLFGCLYPLLSNTYIFDTTQLLLYDFILAIVLTLLSLFVTNEIDLKKIKDVLFAIIVLMCSSLIYGYGTLSFLNEYKDTSELQEFKVEVMKKRVNKQKKSTCYITLSPWHKNTDSEEIVVSERFYNSIQEKDSIHLLLNQGNLGIEWYSLEK
jgi:hypothetical protein